MHVSSWILGLVALSLPLSAQNNVISNGDFEAGLTGWTAGGEGGTPGVISEDITGLGVSKVFSVYPGAKVFAPPHKGYILKQSIIAIPTVEYEFSADVKCFAQNGNAQGPIIEVRIAGVPVFNWNRFVGGIKTGTFAEKIVGRFSQAKAGKFDLEIEILRPKYVYNTRTPRISIDNLKLAISARPSVFIHGDRMLGFNLNLEVIGTPGSAAGIMIAPQLFPTPIKFPGFLGRFELHLGNFMLLMAGALDPKTGKFTALLPVPNDKNLLGSPIYWEGFEIGTQLSIGPAHNFNITK